MGQDPTITLSIKEAGERPNSTYLFHILLDGTPLTSNQSLSLQDSQAVRELSRQLWRSVRAEMQAGDERRRPEGSWESSSSTSGWQHPGRRSRQAVPVGTLRFLVIASEVPEILNLPWELLLPPEGEFLGINPLFRIRRFPSSTKADGRLRRRSAPKAPAPALHGLLTLGSADSGLRKGGRSSLPGHLRPGCGLRLLRPGHLRGAQREGQSSSSLTSST